MKKIFLLFILCSLFVSCEKEITMDMPKHDEKYVVEGWIEQNEYPIVCVTKNSPYFTTVDSSTVMNMIVTNARVIVNDGVTFDTLSGALIDQFPYLAYKGTKIKGVVGKTYFLKIEVGDEILASSTTIPAPVPLDSVWFKVEPNKAEDSLGYLWGSFTDPAGESNYYRLFTKRLGHIQEQDKYYIPVLGSIYEDKFFNGQSFTFSMMRGVKIYSDEENNDLAFSYFKSGDTIVLKASTIDEANYNFWRAAEQDIHTNGNPFVSPVTIISNIEGGLGIWGGYGVSYDTVITKYELLK